jgi:hypothetical protein
VCGCVCVLCVCVCVCVCERVCVYMCLCAPVCACLRVCVCACVCGVCLPVCLSACVCVCLHVSMCVYVCVCVCVSHYFCLCVCVYVCVYVCVCGVCVSLSGYLPSAFTLASQLTSTAASTARNRVARIPAITARAWGCRETRKRMKRKTRAHAKETSGQRWRMQWQQPLASGRLVQQKQKHHKLAHTLTAQTHRHTQNSKYHLSLSKSLLSNGVVTVPIRLKNEFF